MLITQQKSNRRIHQFITATVDTLRCLNRRGTRKKAALPFNSATGLFILSSGTMFATCVYV